VVFFTVKGCFLASTLFLKRILLGWVRALCGSSPAAHPAAGDCWILVAKVSISTRFL